MREYVEDDVVVGLEFETPEVRLHADMCHGFHKMRRFIEGRFTGEEGGGKYANVGAYLKDARNSGRVSFFPSVHAFQSQL